MKITLWLSLFMAFGTATANTQSQEAFTDEQVMSVSAFVVLEQVELIQQFCKEHVPSADLVPAVTHLQKLRDDNFKKVNTPKYEQVKELNLVELKVHTFIRIQAQGSEGMLCNGVKDNWGNTTKEMFLDMVTKTSSRVKVLLTTPLKAAPPAY